MHYLLRALVLHQAGYGLHETALPMHCHDDGVHVLLYENDCGLYVAHPLLLPQVFRQGFA